MYTVATSTATITGATANGTTIVYNAVNTFQVGNLINISGITPASLNIPDAVITARTNSSFTVASTQTGTYVSGGTAVYDELKDHTTSSSKIEVRSKVIGEWNLNAADNIAKVGNYRYRPSIASPTEVNFGVVKSTYDSSDVAQAYTNATNADVIIDGGIDDAGSPSFTISQSEKQKLLFSLEDCFGKNRPRSGINKLMFFPGRYLNVANQNIANGPRYYAASKKDKFKYWCSFRVEVSGSTGYNRGISMDDALNYYIDDAAPFVVYSSKVPTNRIVVKMQTHSGTNQATQFSSKAVPKSWKIQRLNGTSWETLSTLSDSDIPVDGYVELAYGLNTSSFTGYTSNFYYAGDYANASDLPIISTVGYGYLVGASSTSAGTFYIYNGGTSSIVTNNYDTFAATYNWSIFNQSISNSTPFVSDLTNPDYYTSGGNRIYREFQFVDGLRIVVDKMTGPNQTFDLIELSPRLAVDLSDKTADFSIVKYAADAASSGLPVGQLLASSGAMTLFDFDQAFNPNNTYDYSTNTGSIINKYINKNLQIKLYEVTGNVNGYDYYIPVKTLNVLGFPSYDSGTRDVSLELRDQYMFFESMMAPQVFIPNVSLSYAISILLDSIGFSNYVFKRVDGISDPVIPFFFVGPNTSVATVLQNLAVSTQYMMFFDEYNNFVVMSKEYAMPTESQRSVDYVLYGSTDYSESTVPGELGVKTNSKKLANIEKIASKIYDIYNDGRINYFSRYIARGISSIEQAQRLSPKSLTWKYKLNNIWEAPNQVSKISGEESGGYTLTAIPLNSDLSDQIPSYDSGTSSIKNNIVDFGDSVTWIVGYSGYFFSNGEIIKYDAVQYSVDGLQSPVWITSQSEYENYFSKLGFGKKMYPTGLVRIYAKLDKDNNVVAHGRKQFGTDIVKHSSGIAAEWLNTTNKFGFKMQSKYLFDSDYTGSLTSQAAGVDTNIVKSATVSGLLKNPLTKNSFESYNYQQDMSSNLVSATVQSSALILSGPSKKALSKNGGVVQKDFLTYVSKELGDGFNHFGTRVRIVGTPNVDKNKDYSQEIENASEFYAGINVKGGSAGISIMQDTTNKKNNGYYFEIVALGFDNVEDIRDVDNVFFYKVQGDGSGNAIPKKLWSGQAQILCDGGDFVGQDRFTGEQAPSVYDLAIEYKKINSKKYRFYLYLNGNLIGSVDDTSPLPEVKTKTSLFVRGSTKAMFENIYAIRENFESKGSSSQDIAPGNSVTLLDINNVSLNNLTRKYSLSGMIKNSLLTGISSEGSRYKIYYDEFGTIMREMAYFDIKYDRGYPALYARVSPKFTTEKGYAISGFSATPYGAEFLLFNCTDTLLNLSSELGTMPTISGVTLTDNSQKTLTVDDYYNKRADFSNPSFSSSTLQTLDLYNRYLDIKNSRTTYGVKAFELNPEYIQSEDAANELMAWVLAKTSKPRKAVGICVVGVPYAQLGDIVKVDYIQDGVGQVSLTDSRYVVYSIEYNYNEEGPETILYLSEVQ